MKATEHKANPLRKRVTIAVILLLITAGLLILFVFTQKFGDTTKQKAAYDISANDLIKACEQGDSMFNKKYMEQIIVVNGRVFETEAADSSINIKMADTLSGAYIIFAFQQQHLAEAKSLKVGDSVSIKGSCSGCTYSEILETNFITFKRCAINN